MTVGTRIKNRRIELGLSVDEVACKLGKNKATIYRYENDDIENLPTTVLEPLAQILETTPAHLMGWEEEDKTADLLVEVTVNEDLQILVERAMKLSDKNIEQLLKYSEFLLSTEKEND